MSVDPVGIFISSPRDVRDIREAARSAIAQLQSEPAVALRYRLDCKIYEETVPPIAGQPPQRSVDQYMIRPEDADILVCILWSRVGSPHIDETGNAWESGTLYEFELAYQKYRRTGSRPIVLLYRCVRPVPDGADETQVAAVDRFFDRFRDLQSSYQALTDHREFQTAAEFTETLKRDLRQVLEKLRPPQTVEATQTPRQILLQRVRAMWIDGVLVSLLEGRPPLVLPVELFHTLSTNPETSAEQTTIQGETSVWLKGCYRQARNRLVISGEPGSGKSVAVLQLTRQLLEEAQMLLESPVPIVLDAMSWRQMQSFRTWVLVELDRMYGVRRATGIDLVDNKRLCYIIDGLDQIGEQTAFETGISAPNQPQGRARGLRAAWAKEVLDFFRSTDLSASNRTPMILSCRSENLVEYQTLFDEGHFEVCQIQAPSPDDIISAAVADAESPGLAQLLVKSPQLIRIAQTPLFLHMLSSVNRPNSPYRPVPNASDEQQIRELISTYVELRFQSPEISESAATFPLVKIRGWLGWLATHQNRSPFLIELMEPAMLPLADRRFYRLIAAVVLGLLLTVIATIPIASGLALEWGRELGWETGAKTGCLTLLVCGVLGIGFLIPVFYWTRHVWFGLFLGIAFALFRGVAVGGGYPEEQIPAGWEAGIQAAFFTALTIAPPLMIYGWHIGYNLNQVEPLSNWGVDPKLARIGLFIGFAVGALFWAFYGLARGVTFGCIVTIILTTVLFLKKSGIDVPRVPNQAIIRSIRTAFLLSAVIVPVAFVVTTLSYAYQFGWEAGIENGLLTPVVICGVLIFGGIPVIQHLAIRFLVWKRGYFPFRIVPFLNLMATLGLIQRVGGGYRFRHDFIKQYFASLWRS